MKGLRFLAPALAGLLVLAASLGEASTAAGKPVVVERRLALMGTSLAVTVEARDRAAGLAASERAVAAIEAAEGRLSTWRDDTELARLNRAPLGSPFPLSAALSAELRAAFGCAGETGGAFDPTVGPLVAAWGLRRGGRVPAPGELASAVAATGYSHLELTGATAVRRRAGLTIEEGGWGKGAALKGALAALDASPAASRAGRALFDLGGQVAVWSAGGHGSAWTVDVADPRRRERPVIALRVDRGSISTSGNSERAVEVDGRRYGHLLDPHTGRPAADFGSVTVWTADPLVADCLSTGFFVMGPERALAWTAAHPGVEVLVLSEGETSGRKGDLRPQIVARASPGLRRRLEVLTQDVILEGEGPAAGVGRRSG